MNPTILIVEDDPFLRQQVAELVRLNGMTALTAVNGDEALVSLKADSPQLMVLDLGLPDIDGVTVARLARAQSPIPILMLTARSTAADKLLGFELGADDYLTKPFDPPELIARIRALLRRSQPQPSADKTTASLQIQNLRVDELKRRVFVDDYPLNLTSREYELLLYLFRNRGRALSREQIFEQVWGYDIEFSSNTLDVIVYRLRGKITDKNGPDVIETLRGFGYRLADE